MYQGRPFSVVSEYFMNRTTQSAWKPYRSHGGLGTHGIGNTRGFSVSVRSTT